MAGRLWWRSQVHHVCASIQPRCRYPCGTERNVIIVAMNVLLLTQEHCGFCLQAKEILDRLAVEYGFSVSTLDVSSPEGEALAVRSGLLFPPGIVLEGELFSYGRPSERKLRREIERRLRSVQGGTNKQNRLLYLGLKFRLNSCEARREGVLATFHESRMNPVCKPLDTKLDYLNLAR